MKACMKTCGTLCASMLVIALASQQESCAGDSCPGEGRVLLQSRANKHEHGGVALSKNLDSTVAKKVTTTTTLSQPGTTTLVTTTTTSSTTTIEEPTICKSLDDFVPERMMHGHCSFQHGAPSNETCTAAGCIFWIQDSLRPWVSEHELCGPGKHIPNMKKKVWGRGRTCERVHQHEGWWREPKNRHHPGRRYLERVCCSRGSTTTTTTTTKHRCSCPGVGGHLSPEDNAAAVHACQMASGEFQGQTCQQSLETRHDLKETLVSISNNSGRCPEDVARHFQHEWMTKVCCKSSPANVCEKDAKPVSTCKDENDFDPEAVRNAWCEFPWQPSEERCIFAGCKSNGRHCDCNIKPFDAVTIFDICKKAGGLPRKGSCAQALVMRSDFAKRLQPALMNGTCENQKTEWGMDLHEWVQKEEFSQRCCKSYPVTICGTAPTTTTTTTTTKACPDDNGVAGYKFSHAGYWSRGYKKVGKFDSVNKCADKCTAASTCLRFNRISGGRAVGDCYLYYDTDGSVVNHVPNEAYVKCSTEA